MMIMFIEETHKFHSITLYIHKAKFFRATYNKMWLNTQENAIKVICPLTDYYKMGRCFSKCFLDFIIKHLNNIS